MTIESLYNLYKEYPVICTDTRKITPNCIFFALKGDSFNANQFAKQAIENGAAYAIIDEELYSEGDRFVLVNDVLQTLQLLAKYHRAQLNIPFLGITGTNGKTTTKELINAVLSQKFKTYATIGNLNNHIGVPLTLLSIDGSIEFAIIEMGANHQKEIQLLADIANPDFGIITNVGKAHLEGFGGFEGVKKGKKELYDHLQNNSGLIFINHDNPHLLEMASKVDRKVYYGTSEDNTVIGKRIEQGEMVSLEWKLSNDDQWNTVNSNLVGGYNFENVLAAVCIGNYFGLTVKQIEAGVLSYQPTNNRSQAVKTESNTLICDYYNANPSSMAAAIDNFAKNSSTNKLVILADMFELGEYSKEEHQKVINQLKEQGLINALLVGKHFYSLKDNSGYTFFENTEEAVDYLKKHPVRNSHILVKGSRGMKLESLIGLL
ncbi:UDP-N-acetylmuramoyl-tripeptide--D-alanyl-D-alanine ligase [Solitalea sp. MAHUQ-68]|uniref:UDP-N-acetylmuramoyl-tripeptide--D-alanyl-D-alanine ligase n=1 Tax=Solitalea agri TaxID=2953739 RepID=A0A9X2JBT2_9SPHI|nr:UDP-N-acetylmuramoyl-tripeptide--D-alanyl-D-alanine ligase [Solitalea agri]MCO4292807.1 UDP-N-acetylmuramoyl-tripeptide--D-alanyl-D-alanine ligase [Solitalea agri]